jgi:hypothetical protein
MSHIGTVIMSCSPSARRESKLLRQDIAANARPLLEPILSRQDAGIARLEADSGGRRKLMMLVRRNSHSALTCRNGIEIQQGGVAFYGSMVAEIEAARHSVHLQYSYGPRITFFSALRIRLAVFSRIVFGRGAGAASGAPRRSRAHGGPGGRVARREGFHAGFLDPIVPMPAAHALLHQAIWWPPRKSTTKHYLT